MIHNPSTLYSAGDVKLDSTPYLRIAMAQKARQQAIDEAAYRHYSELPDKLNSAGVRAQDWEDPNGNGGIGNDIERTKQFFIENSKDILKGGRASVAYSKMMQDNLRKIQTSKDIAKEELLPGKEVMKVNGWKPDEDDDLPVIHKMSLSMYDPESKKEDGSRFGLKDLSLAAPAYSTEKQKQYDLSIMNGIKPQYDPNATPIMDDVSGKMYNVYKIKPEEILTVGRNAANLAKQDRTMYRHFKSRLKNNPDDIKVASEMLSKVSGVPIVAETPEQLAAGLAMAKAEGLSEQKEETNQALVQARKKALLDQRQAFQRSESAKRRAQSEKNANIIAAKWETTDPYKTLQDNIVKLPTKEFDQTYLVFHFLITL